MIVQRDWPKRARRRAFNLEMNRARTRLAFALATLPRCSSKRTRPCTVGGFSSPNNRRVVRKHSSMWPRRQWSCWQVESQYLTLHRTHRGASWASGAAQAAQFWMIILRFAVSYWACGSLTRLEKPVLYSRARDTPSTRPPHN